MEWQGRRYILETGGLDRLPRRRRPVLMLCLSFLAEFARVMLKIAGAVFFICWLTDTSDLFWLMLAGLSFFCVAMCVRFRYYMKREQWRG